jgi:hypothetical protein
MTIEIEAGASQSQFSMKPLVVHAFFQRQPRNGRLSTTDVDLSRWGAVQEETNSFSKETPSPSLRLRSVQIFVAITNAARTISDVVRPFSGSVRDRFDSAVVIPTKNRRLRTWVETRSSEWK